MFADRKGLKRNAKANVRYDDCDAQSENDDDDTDAFKPAPQRSKAAKTRPEPPVHRNVAPQKRSGGKGQQAKPPTTAAKLRALTAQHDVPVAQVRNGQDLESPIEDDADDAREHEHAQTPAQHSVTVGTNAAPQNDSLASLNPSLRYIPDTGDTAAHAREHATKPKEVTPVQGFKVWLHDSPSSACFHLLVTTTTWT